MLLLVMTVGTAVRTCPVAFVTTVGMLPSVSSLMIDQIFRSLELFPTDVTNMSQFGFMDNLMFFQYVL